MIYLFDVAHKVCDSLGYCLFVIYRLFLLTKCVVVFFVFCPNFVIYLFDVAHKVFNKFVFCPYFVMFVVAHKVCESFVFRPGFVI